MCINQQYKKKRKKNLVQNVYKVKYIFILMTISPQEYKFLIEKYQKEGLKFKEIQKRLQEIKSFNNYVKFYNKYSNKINPTPSHRAIFS